MQHLVYFLQHREEVFSLVVLHNSPVVTCIHTVHVPVPVTRVFIETQFHFHRCLQSY